MFLNSLFSISYVLKALEKSVRRCENLVRAHEIKQKALHITICIYHDVIHALLTKREVRIAGYWPSSFLRFYWPRRSHLKQKRRPICSYLDRTSLVNTGYIIWSKRDLFLAGPTREKVLPALVANQNAGFALIFPARGLNHKIDTEYIAESVSFSIVLSHVWDCPRAELQSRVATNIGHQTWKEAK